MLGLGVQLAWVRGALVPSCSGVIGDECFSPTAAREPVKYEKRVFRTLRAFRSDPSVLWFRESVQLQGGRKLIDPGLP